jgi:hypothetical protein
MFHHHTTQRRIYITADKLRLNKLSQSPTYLASNHCPPATCDYRQRAPKLLQMLLAALVSMKSHAVAKCRLMQVTEKLGSASGHLIQIFGCRDKRPSSGERLTAVSAFGRNMTTLRRPWGCVILLCVTSWKRPRLRAIWTLCFGNRTNGNSGKFLKILKHKMY